MLKIDKKEFKTIDEDIEYLSKVLSINENKLSDQTKSYLMSILGFGIKLDQLFKKDSNDILNIDDFEVRCLKDMIKAIENFFSSKNNPLRRCTIDEMKEKYTKLFASNLPAFSLKLIQLYLETKKDFVEGFNVAYRTSNIDGFIYSLSDEQIKELRNLLGFRKIPRIKLDDGLINDIIYDYYFELTPYEQDQDISIDKSVERKQQRNEDKKGTTIYNQIYLEAKQLLQRCEDVIETIGDEISLRFIQGNYQDEQRLQLLNNLADRMLDIVDDVVHSKTKLTAITSLDELKEFEESLGNDDFWLKKVIERVIEKFSQRIRDFNSSIDSGEERLVLKEMSLWQKYQLMFLRTGNDENIPELSAKAHDYLQASIAQDECERLNNTGLKNIDQYMEIMYERRIKGKNISTFRDLFITKYVCDEIKKKKND